MGKRNSRGGSKKGKSKKSREKNGESNLLKQQQNLEKSAYEEFSKSILKSNVEQNKTSTAESTTETSDTGANESTSETSSDSTNECCEEVKAKQQELLNKLKNLSDSVALITLTRDNTDSLRIELLSSIYFTRQMRPLIDTVNLISFAASNISNVANNININSFGEKKEIKNALELCYKMNDEIDDVLDALSRRIKFYIGQLDNMDKNCPPFDFKRDS